MTLKLDNISKYYYSANAVTQALRRIKLEFDIGEFVAITGESGSGKSTLLNIISGMDTYDDGELYIEGEATSHFDSEDWEEYRKNKMGFVFQNYNLIENYSALYNVESSLLIQGYGNKEAKSTAKELLKKVGLEKQAKQRASRLSSGQKQRLSIARALAKNTDIIVADEPTGNLDSENGRQIMELFSKLSKDKLIIVVTHNYEEAAPFATRKIRLHDGEVVSDIPQNLDNTEEAIDVHTEHTYIRGSEVMLESNENPDNLIQAGFGKKPKSDERIAWRFTLMNISAQPRRVLLFLVFLLVTAAVSFIFLGDIYSNWDDVFTKVYDNNAFLNSDITRIVVKKPDGSEITKDDISRMDSVKYVTMTDQYGFVDDINYYIDLNKDYEEVYNTKDNLLATQKEKYIKFTDISKFMKSYTCITQDDLAAGRLPENRNEVVLYSEHLSDLGKEEPCYFTSKNTWGNGQYYSENVKVVGLLKNKSSQVYFSEELCHMLSLDLYGDSYQMSMCWDFLSQKYLEEQNFIPVIGEDLSSDPGKNGDILQVRVSSTLVLQNGSSAVGPAVLKVFRKNGDKSGTPSLTSDVKIMNQMHDNSPCFIEIGEKEFNQLYSYKSRQAAIYIKDYIYMDKVLKDFKNMGYDAISSYRVSAVEYDPDKVAERNFIIIKALIVLLVISILEIIIIRSIFALKHKDYYILGSMGMNHRMLKLMNYYEMFIYTVFSVLTVMITTKIASQHLTGYLPNMVKYYDISSTTIYVLLNLLVITVTVWSFNKSLRSKQKKV